MIRPKDFDKDARRKAEDHWKWLESLLHKVYVDAMIHGIEHGSKDPEFKYESITNTDTTEVQHD